MSRISTVGVLLLFVLAGALLWAATPAASQDAGPAVTFHKDVLPVLQKNCQSCHRPGQIGPFSMLTYKETRPWAKAIKQAVVTKAMPPWFAEIGRASCRERCRSRWSAEQEQRTRRK